MRFQDGLGDCQKAEGQQKPSGWQISQSCIMTENILVVLNQPFLSVSVADMSNIQWYLKYTWRNFFVRHVEYSMILEIHLKKYLCPQLSQVFLMSQIFYDIWNTLKRNICVKYSICVPSSHKSFKYSNILWYLKYN